MRRDRRGRRRGRGRGAERRRASQVVHAPYGGVVPELASRDHAKNVLPVVREALARAEVRSSDDRRHRGDVPARASSARSSSAFRPRRGIAWARDKPLVGRRSPRRAPARGVPAARRDRAGATPAFPFVALLASGGHTAIYRVDGPRESMVRELGATRDDAAGEAFDKVAKLLGLGYPGGPVVDGSPRAAIRRRSTLPTPDGEHASRSSSASPASRRRSRHACVRIGSEERSGGRRRLRRVPARRHVACSPTKLLAAASHEGVRDVVLGGGVAANRELRRRVERGRRAARHARARPAARELHRQRRDDRLRRRDAPARAASATAGTSRRRARRCCRAPREKAAARASYTLTSCCGASSTRPSRSSCPRGRRRPSCREPRARSRACRLWRERGSSARRP